jgi:hypothetical protein
MDRPKPSTKENEMRRTFMCIQKWTPTSLRVVVSGVPNFEAAEKTLAEAVLPRM